MADVITGLTDDDIRTTWATRDQVAEADDDTTDPGDAADSDSDGTDTEDDGDSDADGTDSDGTDSDGTDA